VYNDSEERKTGAVGGYTYYDYQKLTNHKCMAKLQEIYFDEYFNEGQPGTILKNLKYLWERYPFKVYCVKDFSDHPSD